MVKVTVYPFQKQLGCKKGRVQENASYWMLSNPKRWNQTEIKKYFSPQRNYDGFTHPNKITWFQKREGPKHIGYWAIQSMHSNISDIKGVNCSHTLRLTVKW